MLESKNGNITMTVNTMVRQLSKAYSSIINKNAPLRLFPSVMLWGAPGVGKSQGVRQIAKVIEKETGKKTVVTDVRLLLFNPVDLRGIPTSNKDKTLAVWLKPKIFQMDESEDVINILFLDEISAAPQSVQAAAYQITLDRVVGEHKLPENCIVIAAGNRVTDKSVAYKMPKALANRLCHIEIESNTSGWHNWAVHSGVNGQVTGFLASNPGMLMRFDAESDENAFATPRSWEMVSNILNNVDDDVNSVLELVVGCVGEYAAYEFLNWCNINREKTPVKDIFSGMPVTIPHNPEALFLLTSEMAAYASKNGEGIEFALVYAEKLPTEFRHRLYTDFLNIKKLRPVLRKNREYTDWLIRSGRDWDDYDD